MNQIKVSGYSRIRVKVYEFIVKTALLLLTFGVCMFGSQAQAGSKVKHKSNKQSSLKQNLQDLSSFSSKDVASLDKQVSDDSKQADTSSQIYKIQSNLKKIDSLSVDFVQKIYSPVRDKTRVVEGKGYFSYPDKFKWVRIKPVKEEIYYNGSTLVIYKPDENTAMKLGASTDRSQEIEDITEIILDTGALLDKYKVIESRLDKNTTFLKLFPKDEESTISDIYITIDRTKNYVDNLKISYVDKKSWEFSFSNPSSKKLPASTFKFRPSKKVKVTTQM